MKQKGEGNLSFFCFWSPKTRVFLAFSKDFDYNCLQCVQHLLAGMGYNKFRKRAVGLISPVRFAGKTAECPARKDSPGGRGSGYVRLCASF